MNLEKQDFNQLVAKLGEFIAKIYGSDNDGAIANAEEYMEEAWSQLRIMRYIGGVHYDYRYSVVSSILRTLQYIAEHISKDTANDPK